MSAVFREPAAEDAGALRAFFADVPSEDRSFFKEDVGDPGLAERWLADRRSFRVLAVDDDRRIAAFAALRPGIERTSHVADLQLVVAGRARRRGLGAELARRMLVAAVEHGFQKVTVDVAADAQGPIAMFRGLGFQPEALLRDQLRDPDGELHDLVVLAHAVDEHWSSMLTAGIDSAIS